MVAMQTPRPQSSPAPERFRDAMARLAGAVTLVTTDGPAGRFGLAATAVCSVTDSPPTLLVCVNRMGSATDPILRNGVFCVNTLAAHQKPIAIRFAGREIHHRRFSYGAWGAMRTASPSLEGCLASVDCELTDQIPKGTHLVLFGRVVDIALAVDGAVAAPCLYYDRRFRQLANLPSD